MRSDAILAKMLETPDEGGGGGDIKEEVKNLETILSNKIDKKIGELNNKLNEITKARESAGANTKDNEGKAQTDTKTLEDGGNEDGKDNNESKENG
jgi:phage-related minor tail protein